MHSVLIRDGFLVDGTGADGLIGDLLIKNGCIVSVGTVNGSADEMIHADGRVVCPGFIDIHRHCDAKFLRPSGDFAAAMLAQAVVGRLVRLAAMDHERQAEARGEALVSGEGGFLLGAGAAVAVEIEACLAERDDRGVGGELGQARLVGRRPVGRGVRVDADRGEDHAGKLLGTGDRGHRVGQIAADGQEVGDTGLEGICNHSGPVVVEGLEVQVTMRVEQAGARGLGLVAHGLSIVPLGRSLAGRYE